MLHYPFTHLYLDEWSARGCALTVRPRTERTVDELLAWPLAWVPQVRHSGQALCLHPDDALELQGPSVSGRVFGVVGDCLLAVVDAIGPDADVAPAAAAPRPGCVVELDPTAPDTLPELGGPQPLMRVANVSLARYAGAHLAWLRACARSWQAHARAEPNADEVAAAELAAELSARGDFTEFWQDAAELLREFGPSRGGAMLLEQMGGRDGLPTC